MKNRKNDLHTEESCTDKRIPLRTCVGCNKKRTKQELLRVVRGPDGRIAVDVTGRMNGRGAYLCKDMACLEAALKRKGFNRTFRVEITGDDTERLREFLDEI